MIFCSVWAICALCVVLFIRGAHPYVERPEGDNGNDLTVGGDGFDGFEREGEALNAEAADAAER
ncbi:MAG: hypothetical protein CBARDCOR_2105 [uncultured Caballeronia sp.]|nr:MAG: hypothetical protein CBARDCOR_2105 [uncultured Caballeronia sp.]